MVKCRCCSADISESIFSGNILGNSVAYFECATCGYVQTEDPTWLDQAYSSVINGSDTGIMVRNQANVRVVLGTLASIGARRGRVVDFAGGYGLLVRMLRDKGVEALWTDPFCENLVAVGFEYSSEGGKKSDLVTAFEAFEHFADPVSEIEKMFSIGENLLVSTEIIPTPAPSLTEWWYYGLDHGQHIGFFRVATLEFIAKRFGKHLVTDGRSLHLFTDRPVSDRRWRINLKVARRFPSLLAVGSESKTWSDHEQMSSGK